MRRQMNRTATKPKTSRAGYTLIEAVGLVLIVGLVLSFTCTLLAGAMRSNRVAMQLLTSQAELRNLHHRLQEDLRSAVEVSFHSPDLLEIADGSSSIVYRFQSDHCDRVTGDAAAFADVFQATGQRWQLPGAVQVDCKTLENKQYPLLIVALKFEDPAFQQDAIRWAIRYNIDE